MSGEPATEAAYLQYWTKKNEERQDQDVTFDGITVRVYKDVFCPDKNLTHLPQLLTHLMSANLSGKRVLDLGTGCGILALHAAKNGAAEVVATDIDPRALENARENVSNHGLGHVIEVIASDLFDNVEGKFDLIIANLPILDSFWNEKTGPTADMYRRFLAQIEGRLNPGGVALLGFASFGDMSAAQELILPNPLLTKLVCDRKWGVDWYVYQFENQVERSVTQTIADYVKALAKVVQVGSGTRG